MADTVKLLQLAQRMGVHTKIIQDTAEEVGLGKLVNLSELKEEDVKKIELSLAKGSKPDLVKKTAKKAVVKKSATKKVVTKKIGETSGTDDAPVKPKRRRRPILKELAVENTIAVAENSEVETEKSQEILPKITARAETEVSPPPVESEKAPPVKETVEVDETLVPLVNEKPPKEKGEPSKEKEASKNTPQSTPKESVAVAPEKANTSKKKGKEKRNIQKVSFTAMRLKHSKEWGVTEKSDSPPPASRPAKKNSAKPFKPSKNKYRQEPQKKSGKTHTFNPRKKKIRIEETISATDLASLIGVKIPEIISALGNLKLSPDANELITTENVELIASEFGVEVEINTSSIEDILSVDYDAVSSNYVNRPPVVTLMGHVDHGKTSLLDSIRKTNISEGESGGITQHIGAYYVKTANGSIAFLDTPGHEAFTAMRARGANATDIVILVVACDDGPKQQTIEAIAHAQAAEAPLIVALNKADKEGANIDKTMQMLMEHGLVSETYGGDCTMIPVSAKTGDGIPELLDMVSLQAETMELFSDKSRPSTGVIIEAKQDKHRGNLVTALVQQGVLKQNSFLVAGSEYGKVRALINDKGEKIKQAEASIPVEILGLNGLPQAGDTYHVLANEKLARQIAEKRTFEKKENSLQNHNKVNMENFFSSIAENEKATLPLLIKTDVIGSLEPIINEVTKLGNDKVSVKVIYSAVGAVSESDVTLALTSNAIIACFNVRPDNNAKKIAQENAIEIRLYSVIYELIADVKDSLEGLLEPVVKEEIIGKLSLLEIFTIPKVGVIAGCKVLEGKIIQGCFIRVIRDNIVVHDGKLNSLRRIKDDVKEVQAGFECGISVQSYKDYRQGDIFEVYSTTTEVARL